jgi:hypothetical protein
MKKNILTGLILLLIAAGTLHSTPSTQLWIPSTDFQPFGKVHLGFDNYLRLKNSGVTRGGTIFCAGITVGVLPFKKLQAEVGADYYTMSDPLYDKYPALFNVKVGLPEDALFKNSPSIAVGVYNIGTKKGLTNYNMAYGLIAKTIPVIGRISVGYYFGNEKVLLDAAGKADNQGLLISWDRSMSEISDKLWMAVDYQGGKNCFGSLNFGFSWAFSKNVSAILAYDIWNDKNVLYNSKDQNLNSVTIQVDINF